MRLAIIVAAAASESPDPELGERDASIVSSRIAMKDMGFRVHVLDPAVDLAEQLDELLTEWQDDLTDVLLYASCLVAVVGPGECFLCLDPTEPDVGDSLQALTVALAERVPGAMLAIVDARFEADAEAQHCDDVVAAIKASMQATSTGIELIVAVRPKGAHNERIPSRLTAGLLEAIDSHEGPISARRAYAVATQATDFGDWPSAVDYVPAMPSFALRVQLAEATPAVAESRRATTMPGTRRGMQAAAERAAAASLAEAVTRPAALSPAPLAAGLATALEAPAAASASPAPGNGRPRLSPLDNLEATQVSEGGTRAPRSSPTPSSKVESSKVESSKVESSNVESSNVESSNVESSNAGSSNAESSNVDLPAGDGPDDSPAVEEPSPRSAAPESLDEMLDVEVESAPAPKPPPPPRAAAERRPGAEGDARLPPPRAEPAATESGAASAAAGSPSPISRPQAPPPRPADKPLEEMSIDDHIALADYELDHGDLDKASAEYKMALGKMGTASSPERAHIYVGIGELNRKRGKARVAISNFDKALSITPDDVRALGALVELHFADAAYPAAEKAEERLLAAIADPEVRCERAVALARRWLGAEKPTQARRLLEQARDAFPDRLEPLQLLAQIYEKLGEIDALLETRRQLAARIDDPAARARAFFEIGELAMFEAHREQDAFDAFEAALDCDPTMLEALEVLATALAENQEWAELERVYLKMIARIEASDSPQAQRVVVELYQRLALLYRDHLEDPELALDALERQLALVPDKTSSRLAAAELAEELSQPGRALALLREGARVSPRGVDAYHAIFRLCMGHHVPDVAFLAASVTVLCGDATPEEAAVHQQDMVQGVPSHQRPMRIEAREWLRDANRDHIVDAVMRSIAPAVLRLRVLQLEADGKLPVLDERKRHDPKSSTLSAVRSIAWGSQFLGIDAPAIHVDKDAPHAIAAVFAKQQSLIVGAEALGGKTVGELAFLVGQHLALRLPEHELVAHYAGIEELSVCFLAALRLVLRSSVPPGGKLARAVEALAGLVAKTITEDELEELTTAAWKLETGGGKVNLNEWVASVERCAARTGLLLCGNLQTAAKLLRAQKEGASCLGAEARIDDLCSFAVSDGYLRLRQELGSAISDKKPFGGSGASDG